MKEVYLSKKIQDIIAEYAEAKGIPYSKAEKIVIYYFKSEAEKNGVSLQEAIDIFSGVGGQYFSRFVDVIRGAKPPAK